MNYERIREKAKKQKKSHPKMKMDVHDFAHFSVMTADNGICVIVDRDIAEKAKNRKWCIDGHGYAVVNMGNEPVRLHDFALAMRGYQKPENSYVDHINHDKLDNRLINLRFVSPQESSRNMPLKSNNTSGITGVSKTKSGTYRAYITADKKRVELGRYKTIDEAAEARREAEDRLGFVTRPGTVRDRVSFLIKMEGIRDVETD